MIFGAVSIGQLFAVAPSYTKARLAANRIVAILNRIPAIDSYSAEGEKPEKVTHHTTMPLGLSPNFPMHYTPCFVTPYHSSFHRPRVKLSYLRCTSLIRQDQKWRC